eukprot:TRINITY_DN25802_c0_g1_i1.p1 TRINITY_DN25802_c0_g1~~TRINITY_DN25802_c0_g1_i1.p1  ORF type:complete len:367 (-),score=77.75 TRINITY_DN25802_c0_g1_i1:488-1588(-)
MRSYFVVRSSMKKKTKQKDGAGPSAGKAEVAAVLSSKKKRKAAANAETATAVKAAASDQVAKKKRKKEAATSAPVGEAQKPDEKPVKTSAEEAPAAVASEAKVRKKKKKQREGDAEKKTTLVDSSLKKQEKKLHGREESKASQQSSKTSEVKSESADDKTDNPYLLNTLTVFVGGFPFNMSEAQLREDFEKCGEIKRFTIPKDSEGKRRGIAYITFTTKAGVEAACKLDRSDYGGRLLMVNKVGPPTKGKGEKGNGKGAKGDGVSFDNEVSIRGLSWSTTSDELKAHFEKCGEITNLKLLYNEEGKVRGTAFVAFASHDGLKKALAFNETEFGGRTIYVCKSGDFGGKGKGGKGGKGKGKSKGKKN